MSPVQAIRDRAALVRRTQIEADIHRLNRDGLSRRAIRDHLHVADAIIIEVLGRARDDKRNGAIEVPSWVPASYAKTYRRVARRHDEFVAASRARTYLARRRKSERAT